MFSISTPIIIILNKESASFWKSRVIFFIKRVRRQHFIKKCFSYQFKNTFSNKKYDQRNKGIVFSKKLNVQPNCDFLPQKLYFYLFSKSMSLAENYVSIF